MMKFYCIILLLSFSSAYAIDSKQCPNFDFRDNFPPVRDQDSHGICWAFTGAALLEEKLCQKNPKMCGQPLSVIDGHRCWWTEEGGLGVKNREAASSVYPYIDCSIRNGVCLEKDAPFEQPVGMFDQDQKFYTEQVKKAFRQVAKLKKKLPHDVVFCNGNCAKNNKQVDILHEIKEISDELADTLAKRNDAKALHFTKQDYYNYLFRAQNEYEAMKSIFIPPQCREKRLDFSNLSYKRKYVESKSIQEKLNFLAEAAKAGSSSSLEICASQVMSGSYKDASFIDHWFMTEKEYYREVRKSRCGGHAILAVASRWKDGRCQIFIRNSWGNGSAISEWQDAEQILRFTRQIGYLK